MATTNWALMRKWSENKHGRLFTRTSNKDIHQCLGILSYLDWHLALAADDIKHLKGRKALFWQCSSCSPNIESINTSVATLADDHNGYPDVN